MFGCRNFDPVILARELSLGCYNGNTMDVTGGTRTIYPSGASDFELVIACISGVRVVEVVLLHIFKFTVMIYATMSECSPRFVVGSISSFL